MRASTPSLARRHGWPGIAGSFSMISSRAGNTRAASLNRADGNEVPK